MSSRYRIDIHANASNKREAIEWLERTLLHLRVQDWPDTVFAGGGDDGISFSVELRDTHDKKSSS